MGELAAVGILRVLHVGRDGDVLCHLTAEGCCQHLDAAADAEDGDLTIVSQTGDEQLRKVALLIDASQTW